jgi:hypothetical protein
MTVAEPVTVLTDYILAVTGCLLGVRLRRRAAGHESRRLLAAALLITGVSALVGGTSHGLGTRLDPWTHAGFWRVTYYALGLANLALIAAAARAFLRPRLRRWLLMALWLRLLLCVVLLAQRRELRYVVYDAVLTAVILLVLAALAVWTRRDPSAAWLVAGVAVSMAGASAQALRLAPHPLFNHNDLFHVVETLGLVLFYEAGRRLADRD